MTSLYADSLEFQAFEFLFSQHFKTTGSGIIQKLT